MAKTRRKFTKCLNCAYTFNDANNYCPNCGQENHDLNVPVKHLVWEFLEGTMHYDTKVLRTVKYLLFKPGKLTNEFNTGRRASYVPPFRLYIFISLVFFSVLAMSPNVMKVGAGNPEALEQAATGKGAEFVKNNTLQAIAKPPVTSTTANELELFGKKALEATTKDPKLLRDKMIKNTSFMMFLLMPLFGYLLYIFYRKMKRNYVEHLMFSIHLHCFFFVVFIAYLTLSFVLPESLDLFSLLALILLGYTYLAMLRVYKQPYLKTLLKFIPVVSIYLFSLVVALLGNVVISILMS